MQKSNSLCRLNSLLSTKNVPPPFFFFFKYNSTFLFSSVKEEGGESASASLGRHPTQRGCAPPGNDSVIYLVLRTPVIISEGGRRRKGREEPGRREGGYPYRTSRRPTNGAREEERWSHLQLISRGAAAELALPALRKFRSASVDRSGFF